MGTWGPAAFDNDTALDFVVVVKERGFKAVANRLTEFDHENDDDCAEAIAAAAIVAAARGHLVDEFPVEIVSKLGTFRKRTTDDDVLKARQALEQIKKKSEWKNLWRETGDTRQLTKVLNDLLKRLSADPVDLPPKLKRPKPPKIEEGDLFVTHLGFGYWCAVKILLVSKIFWKGMIRVGVYDLVLEEPALPDRIPNGFLLTRNLLKEDFTCADDQWTKVARTPITDDERQLTMSIRSADRSEVWLGDKMIRYATKKDEQEIGLPTFSGLHGDFQLKKGMLRQIGCWDDSTIWYLDRLVSVEDWNPVIKAASNVIRVAEKHDDEDRYPEVFVADALDFRAKAYQALGRRGRAEQDLRAAAELKRHKT